MDKGASDGAGAACRTSEQLPPGTWSLTAFEGHALLPTLTWEQDIPKWGGSRTPSLLPVQRRGASQARGSSTGPKA